MDVLLSNTQVALNCQLFRTAIGAIKIAHEIACHLKFCNHMFWVTL